MPPAKGRVWVYLGDMRFPYISLRKGEAVMHPGIYLDLASHVCYLT